jgi:D-alanyl-D-alanine carboxypeptidase
MALAVTLLIGGALTGKFAHAGYASFVIDQHSGEVLHETNADDLNYPASLTKMMTLYLLFEALGEKRITLQDEMTVSARAASRPPSRLDLKRGDRIKVEDAILALVTKSANDVASTVAEALAPDEKAFAVKMTQKARALGMASTVFRNASGLPNREQVSTARDMAKLAIALRRDFPNYYAYFGTQEFEYAGQVHENHNHLLGLYDGADGIKTGFIGASGFNVVVSAERDGRRLVTVLFGGNTARKRDTRAMELLDAGFGLADLPPEKEGQKRSLIARADPLLGEVDKDDGTTDQGDAEDHPRKIASKKKGAGHSAIKEVAEVGGRWGIQVGAYASQSAARNAAERISDQLANLVTDGIERFRPFKTKHGKTLYRAQLVGLEKANAEQACKVLKANKQTCLVITAKQRQLVRN